MRQSAHGITPIYDEAFNLARQVFSTLPEGWVGHEHCSTCDTAMVEHLARTIRAAVASERLACAKIAESEPRVWERSALDPQQRIGAKIRARGALPVAERPSRRDTAVLIDAELGEGRFGRSN